MRACEVLRNLRRFDDLERAEGNLSSRRLSARQSICTLVRERLCWRARTVSPVARQTPIPHRPRGEIIYRGSNVFFATRPPPPLLAYQLVFILETRAEGKLFFPGNRVDREIPRRESKE